MLDSLVFVLVATLTGVFSWDIFVSLVFTNYLLKCVIEGAYDAGYLRCGVSLKEG